MKYKSEDGSYHLDERKMCSIQHHVVIPEYKSSYA